MARVELSDYDLSLLRLALRGYVEGLDGEYDDDHVSMDALAERLGKIQRRTRIRTGNVHNRFRGVA